jgi:hypothetical protein
MRSFSEFKDMCEINEAGCWLYPHVRSNGNIFYMYYFRDETNLIFPENKKRNTKGRGRILRIDVRRWLYSNLVHYIPKNIVLDNTCGEPSCINPAHMKEIKITRSKFTEKDILDIFTEYSNPPFPSLISLARKYKVSPSTLYDIQSGRNWRSLHPEIIKLAQLRHEKFYGIGQK